MINNNYELSLKLYVHLKSIENLLMFCPIKDKLRKKYENDFLAQLKLSINTAYLLFPSKNNSVSAEKISLLHHRADVFSGEISKAFNMENKKNVRVALNVLMAEVKALIEIL